MALSDTLNMILKYYTLTTQRDCVDSTIKTVRLGYISMAAILRLSIKTEMFTMLP